MSNKQLADELRAYRHENKLSQYMLAKRLGISVRTVEGWEQGRAPQGFAKIALLNILMGGNGNVQN